MRNFNQGRDRDFGDRRSSDRGSSRGGSGSFGRRPERGGFGGGRSGGAPMMHKAVCFECGKECEVPFRPTGGKPVFCSNCFENKNQSEGRSDNHIFPKPRFSDSKFSDNKFGDRKFSDNKFSEEKKPITNAKLEEIIMKLDKIVRLLTPAIDLKKTETKIFETKAVEVEKNVKKDDKKKVVKPVAKKVEKTSKAKAVKAKSRKK